MPPQDPFPAVNPAGGASGSWGDTVDIRPQGSISEGLDKMAAAAAARVSGYLRRGSDYAAQLEGYNPTTLRQQHPVMSGVGQGISDAAAGFLTDPRNLALAGPVGALRPVKAVLGGQMAYGAYESAEAAYKAYKAGDIEQASRMGTASAVNAVGAGAIGLHAMYSEGAPSEGPVTPKEHIPGDSVVPTPITPRRAVAESALSPKEFQTVTGQARALREMQRPENQPDFRNWKPDEIKEYQRLSAQNLGESEPETSSPFPKKPGEKTDTPTRPRRSVQETERSEVDPGFSAAMTPEGKLKMGTDTKRLTQILGSSLYGNRGASVVAKELLQNAYDAVRTNPSSRKPDVSIHIDEELRKFTVQDNGSGMNMDELSTVFTDLGSSGKVNQENASGGFGLAKAAPFTIPRKLEVETRTLGKDGNIHSIAFESTPEDIISGNVNPRESVWGSHLKNPGTTITAHFTPKEDLFGVADFAARSAGSTRAPAKLRATMKYFNQERITNLVQDREMYAGASSADTHVTSVAIPDSAKIDIYKSSKSNPMSKVQSSVEVEIQNNGLFQFSKNHWLGSASEIRGVPSRIVMDIKSLVPEGHVNYPFAANRESLREMVDQKVDSLIKEHFVEPAVKQMKGEISAIYDKLPRIMLGDMKTNPVILDAGSRMTSTETLKLQTNPAVKQVSRLFQEVVNSTRDRLATSENFRYLSSKNLGAGIHRTGLVLSDKVHGLYVSSPADPTQGTLFLNPFSFTDLMNVQDATSLRSDEAASLMWHTIKHEIIHDVVKGHNESFTTAEATISKTLGLNHEIAQLNKIKDFYERAGSSWLKEHFSDAVRIYAESRRRNETAPDILRGEKLSNEIRPPGEGSPESVSASRDRDIREEEDDPRRTGEAGPAVGRIVKANKGGVSSVLSRLFGAIDNSPEEQQSRNIIRAAEGNRNRFMDGLHEEFEKVAKAHDSDTVSDLIAFNNAGEGKPGASFLNPKDQAIATRFHDIYQDVLRPQLQSIDPEKWGGAGIENYLGRMFKKGDSQATAESMVMQKGPFAGRQAFTKHRAYQWIDESIAAGATPITNNPIRMQTLVMNQIVKFISANKAFDAFKEQGLTKFYSLGGNKIAESADPSLGRDYPPAGWTRIDDSMFKPRYKVEGVKGLVESGNYYMHPDAAKVFNNWLKPGLRGDWRYDTARTIADTLNMSQLGFSAFHFTTTSLAGAATSDVALGLQQLAKGKPLRGLMSMAKGMTVLPSVLETYSLGHIMENEYLRPGSMGGGTAKLANLLEDVNGGIGQGLQWDKNRAMAFQKMWGEGGIMNKIGAVGLKGVPAASEWTSRWLMRYYVPRIKLGMFAKMAYEAHESLLEKGASRDEINTEIGKIWDSVDNRAGQMRYKNRFWNPVTKDLSQIAVRSVGWSGGTIAELGGGGYDAAKLLTGQGPLSARTSYLLAAPMVAAGVGGVMHYFMTGQIPRKAEDYFYPGPDGHKLSVPTYVGRDMAAWSRDPVTTALNKLNPLIQETVNIMKNSDFYDVEIRHTGDPLYRQAEDVGKFLLRTNVPISVQSAQQEIARGEEGWKSAARSQLGFTPAPAWVGRSKFENSVYDLAKRNWKAGPRTTEEFDRSRAVSSFRSQKAAGKLDPNTLYNAVQNHQIRMSDLDKILSDDPSGASRTDQQFGALNVRQQFGVLKDADANELAHYAPLVHLDQLQDLPQDEQDILMNEWNKLQK